MKKVDTVTSLNRTPQGSPAMETKLPVESSSAERPPIHESPRMVTASGQHGFELTGNPTMPQSGLQWRRPSTVATNKAIQCPLQTTDPFLSPEKAGQKSGCGAYTDDHLLLQGKALFFPLPMKQGMLGKSHLPLPLPPSLVLYWFLENSLKRKPGVLRCSLPSPKLIVSLGREGHRNAGPKPPLYVRTVLEAFQGSPVCQLLGPVLVCALTCDVFLTLPPYNPCMNDSAFPCCFP